MKIPYKLQVFIMLEQLQYSRVKWTHETNNTIIDIDCT